MDADEKRKNGADEGDEPDEDKEQDNAMTADGSDGHATLHLEIPKKTNFLTLHSNEFEIHSSSLVLQDGTVLEDLKVDHEKKSILLNVRLPCEIEPQKDAKFIFTYTIKLTNKVHDMPEITLQIDPHIQAIVDKAKETGRKATADDLGDLTSDSNFLNNLQSGVNKWINEIRKITRLDHDPLSGTALQETTFWTSIEKELHHINEMRESEEVLLTLEALKLGKRFHATVSFDADTGLKEMLSQAADYNQVMKDLPLNDLMSAGDVDAIRLALVGVLACFKKIRNTKYPAKRAMDLFSVISADTCNQMIKVLRPQRLMHMEMADFDAVMQACTKLFTYWDDEQQNHLQAIFRDMAKKQKCEVKFTYRIPLQHKSLEARLEDVHKFRRQHEQLSGVIARVMRASGRRRTVEFYSDQNNPAKQVAKAYDDVKEVDCLNITKEGVASWESAMSRYREQISRIETQLAIRLREQLGNARNADEMFSIFSRFNALFVRPHIRSAIREFQTQLIECVKKDIDELTTVYLSEDWTNRALEGIRRLDIPETSARIMWYRQIESLLNTYMKRVEDVLGDQWANHIDGKELMKESERLRQKLDTKPMFDDWVKRVENKCKTPNGRLYVIEKLQKEGKVVHHLKVNYAPETIVIAKEVRNLKNMGFRLPFKIMSLAHSASSTYPYAISLLESVKNYDATNEKVSARKGIDQLVANYRRTVHELLTEGYALTWDNYKIETYVARMADATNIYNEKVYDLIEALDGIEVDMKALDTCQYSESVIGQLLASMQKWVDQLVVGKYSNLKRWVDEVDRAVESKLSRRVEEAIHVWTKALSGTKNELEEDEKEKKIQPEIVRMKLEIRVSSQIITAIPPLEKARYDLLNQFYAWHSIASNQPRIVHGQFKLPPSDVPTYKSVMTNMQHRERIMDEVLESINTRMAKVGEYVNQWTQYQALWDLQSDSLYERLGDELQNWMTALVEIKAARSQVDTQESEFEIFPFVIDYARVQTKISVKYEYWQREVLQKFGSLLGSNMQKFYGEVSKWRSDLELQSIDSTSTSDTVALITYVQTLKKQVKPYQEQVNKFIAGQKLLSHNRYQFPKAWLYAENVEGEWSALLEILSRKDVSIQSQVANLQSRISEEDRVLERHIDDMLAEWNKLKPVQGTSPPRDSIATLRAFDERFKKMRDDLTNVTKAKTALEMSEVLGLPGGDQNKARLDNSMEELQDLLGVWQALSPVYEALDAEKEKLWSTIQPRKIRTFLDERLTELKNLSSQYRSYEAYEHAKRLLQHYSQMNVHISELKSEALKDRHWKQLVSQMRVNWCLSDLTLGQVWDADLSKHESTIKAVLYVAQGELALEEFMRQVKDYWTNFVVELVNYQQKTRLIKGWDDLFNKLKEHMSSLAAMKLSPYFKQFEEEALAWEDRLNRINALFDVWIDVQRRWVYLEGLFSGSADIAYLLPTETSRFNVVSTEFLGMMKKVAASPRILEVVNIQGAQRILERLADMLAKIQKALGEYLERERSSFPRFYFVGDEDLLEILGNSKDIVRVQKHMKKMFAGIVGIEFNEERRLITAMLSREGERVELQPPVDLNDAPKVNDWLRKLEHTMQATLSKLLDMALTHLTRFDISSLTHKDFMDWLDHYPAQVVSLAMEIWWTKQVDADLTSGRDASPSLGAVQKCLSLLSDSVLREQPPLRRRKIENLITELVHKKDVCRSLLTHSVKSNLDFNWLKAMRFYWAPSKQGDPIKSCVVKMANAQFYYGFEYLGVQEKLVQTPLTDRCYLTMTQALHCRLGGSPFGPAGTGKTETVKALGHHLGRFVLVFNCDETFDFQAIGRILVGLCQVGAWGCFDEFNRLEERMLSAVSQQIQTIQEAIKAGGDMKIDLVGKALAVNPEMAIFITMNPGYSGRSNLPDNLKQLFRSLAMTQPDRKLIAEVMLFSQGFQTAEVLAQKIVPLFTLCQEQLSSQCHYDFGLRALKYVLVSAGNIKREEIQRIVREVSSIDPSAGEEVAMRKAPEQQVLIQSVCETLVPKLVSEDIALLFSLLQDVFPDAKYLPKEMKRLREVLATVSDKLFLCHSANPDEKGYQWMEKVLQLYQITNLNHGLMLVGPSGSGKTLAWKVLLKSLELIEGAEGVAHVIDAKAMSKEVLYGVLDPNTREWTDGLFTHIIRRIIDNVRGEADKRQWIIFDGDVDPEWVENLNSVLDDNKLLTLPNGERLAIPPNVRIIFEVADLKYATLATVSRCGMVWFSSEIVTSDMPFDNFLARLNLLSLFASNNVDKLLGRMSNIDEKATPDEHAAPQQSREMEIQQQCVQQLSMHLSPDGLITVALNYSLKNVEHVMDVSKERLLMAFFSMTNFAVKQMIEYDRAHSDFPATPEQIENFISRSMLVYIIWSMSGDGGWKCRKNLSDFIRGTTSIGLPPNETLPIVDFNISVSGGWEAWFGKVPSIEVGAHRVGSADVVIPTMGIVRHELLLRT